ncbi:MAG: YsnF/AvaK domain-containing protein [Geminicoccaceae bacterium]
MGSDDERIALAEEQLEVGTREVDRRRVRIRTKVDTREELVEAALRQDDVSVERVPIGRLLDAVPAVREEDGVLIVPVLEERLVVTKQLFLKEEVRVSSRTRLETVRQPVLLRSERVELSRDESPDPDNPDHPRQELNDAR